MYCTLDQIRQELELNREPDRTDQELTLACQQACDLIDAYTGRHFKAEPVIEQQLPIAGSVLLAHWPVHSVLWVRDADEADVSWQMANQAIGELLVACSRPVRVNYYYNDPDDPVPQDVARAAAILAARIASGPSEFASQFSAGQLSVHIKDNPLISQQIRWILLRYVHRRRFL